MSQAGIINPNIKKLIYLTKKLKELTKKPNNNNSNFYINNSIQYNPIRNSAENVFITQQLLNSNKLIKILQPSSLNFRQGLNNNKKNLKNSHPLFGNVVKSLLIQEQGYNEAGVFIGTAKIWLVYNSNLGFFDYVIEINPSQKFTSNTNKITKTIIPFIIRTLDISLIINALKKFGVENIDEEIAKINSKNFRWSFNIESIPRKLHLTRKPNNNS
jgi:cyclophilin family peptidyl-prolyl cis-trans isomerase